MNTKLIFSIAEIFSEVSISQDSVFCIPAYQRGYKWKPEAVTRLLEDVDRFDNGGDDEKFYCLQNITLIKSDEGFNVVDGQQRLTTILIILACLGEQSLFNNKLVYKVRPKTQEFIASFLSDEVKLKELSSYHSWGAFIRTYPEYDYQDIYYVYMAYAAINEWLSSKASNPSTLDVFKHKFLEHTKLIVNLIKNSPEQDLFKNLNGGKVNLDGADLVRALVITNVARKEFGDEQDVTKRIVQFNESRTRIGIQIDTIMQWWKDNYHFSYYEPVFRHFRSTEEMEFNHKIYPIDGLYKLFSILNDKDSATLSLFEKDTCDLWLQLQTLQRTLEDWYEDREIYHLLMYVCQYKTAESGKVDIVDNFKFIYNQWNDICGTRTAFVRYLKHEIKDILSKLGQRLEPMPSEGNDKDGYETLCMNEDWYKDNGVYSVMVLLDIIDILRPGSTHENLKPNHFRPFREDKEHIFPQLPVGGKINQKKIESQQTVIDEYLSMVQDEIIRMTNNPEFKIDVAKPNWTDETAVNAYRDEVNGMIEKVIPINSLGNICLLNESVNRRYGNEFFSEKRIALFSSAHNGDYIRPHVYNAFDKVWLNSDDNDLHIEAMRSWDKQDIINRRKWIVKRINGFLENEQAKQ